MLMKVLRLYNTNLWRTNGLMFRGADSSGKRCGWLRIWEVYFSAIKKFPASELRDFGIQEVCLTQDSKVQIRAEKRFSGVEVQI